MSVEIKQIDYTNNEADRQLWNKIRFEVFVDEQECPMELEMDGLDHIDTAYHFLLTLDGQPAGICRILKALKDYTPEGSENSEKAAKFGRIAVSKKFRRKGLATKLIDFCSDFIAGHEENFPVRYIAIHSQWYARTLYEGCGYVPQGEIFVEDLIDHKLFAKKIR